MERVTVKPEILRWASERSGQEATSLLERFPHLSEWQSGELKPTLKQLETFAKATYTPIGYFFLPEPLIERVPIPDFRSMAGAPPERPSPNLLDTIYICQERQEWYHDYARAGGDAPLSFVGTATLSSGVEATAANMRALLHFDLEQRRLVPTWADALRLFLEQADSLGVLVMASGVVGSNNRRKLDPQEFRGFALVDDLAPLVFVNAADTKAAQMFTLAHELAHIWLGQSGVSNVSAGRVPDHQVERWCNAVAAELLVPMAVLRDEYRPEDPLMDEAVRLARRFKVSTLVMLWRIYDAGGLTQAAFRQAYQAELERLLDISKGGGGNFYLTQAARVGKRFARALIVSTLEGQTLHRDAFRLLGFSKVSTFQELGRSLGVG